MEARLQFAKKYIHKGNIWKHVIFSDEKKFNLDGPDGFNYYWHDLRKKGESYRKQGGGSVTIWATFKKNKKSEIVFVKGRMNTSEYGQ